LFHFVALATLCCYVYNDNLFATVNAEVKLTLPGGNTVRAVVTNKAVLELGLKEGVAATALIKASSVILAVPA